MTEARHPARAAGKPPVMHDRWAADPLYRGFWFLLPLALLACAGVSLVIINANNLRVGEHWWQVVGTTVLAGLLLGAYFLVGVIRGNLTHRRLTFAQANRDRRVRLILQPPHQPLQGVLRSSDQTFVWIETEGADGAAAYSAVPWDAVVYFTFYERRQGHQ